jgi:hypothetical protein
MVFELLEKIRCNKLGLLPMQVSIANQTVSFGRTVVEFFDKPFISIYIDRINNQVGFKATNDTIKGFKIQKTKGGKTEHITSKSVMIFPRGRFDSKFDDGFVVIKVPEIASDKNE